MPSLAFTGLLSYSMFLPVSFSFYISNQPPLPFHDQVRERHLYTGNKRQGLFLEISPDGTVRGNPVQTANSVLELKSVRPGETVIKGISSSLYLCVDSLGHLRGQHQYKEADCSFKELLLADGYTIFLSPHQGLPVSLSSKQFGQKHGKHRPFSQFLPVVNQLLLGMDRVKKEREHLKQRPENMDLESDDPLGMRLSAADSFFSPGFISR